MSTPYPSLGELPIPDDVSQAAQDCYAAMCAKSFTSKEDTIKIIAHAIMRDRAQRDLLK